MSSKKSYPSANQKNLLIQIVEADPQLRSGKFCSTFTKKDSEKRWKDIAEALNGANKSWEGWRKTWQDRKSNVKKKFALARRQANLTGGGPPPKTPTDEEYLILSTIPTNSLIGHTSSQESIVESFIDIPTIRDSETCADGSVATEMCQVVTGTIEDVTDGTVTTEMCQVVTGTMEDVTEEQNAGITLPRPSTYKPKYTKQQRLDRCLKAANSLNENLKEKINIKKSFYNEYLQLMKQQTDALMKIANSMNTRNSPYIYNIHFIFLRDSVIPCLS